jgi:Bacterial SH3 domain
MKRTGQAMLSILIFTLPSLALADQSPPLEREFPFSLAAVQAVLQQLGAYRGARLPSLSGFIGSAQAVLQNYERPYYEFTLDLKPLGASQTRVSVQANISAWYADPQASNSSYQKFPSNGRLEADLLDRLGDFLNKNRSTLALDIGGMEREIESIRNRRADADRHIAELQNQLQELKTSFNETSRKDYVAAGNTRVAVRTAPDNRASVLLRAEPDDEFEIIEHRGEWSQVRLEGDRRGWIRNSLVRPGASAADGERDEGRLATVQGFAIVREIVSPFSGEWTRLKHKPALYVWARPEGSTLNGLARDKLQFAEHIFMERYRQAAHDSQNSVAGVVVIFLDQRGGVAAASLDDIHFWVEGSLTSTAFVKRCSLDPAGAFGNPAVAPHVANR